MKFINWFKSMFMVISLSEANSMGLTWIENIHGDEINAIGCRSLWRDAVGNTYRVKALGKL